MAKWEYKVMAVLGGALGTAGCDAQTLESNLESLGKEGWELVTLAGKHVTYGIFKRPIPEAAEPEQPQWIDVNDRLPPDNIARAVRLEGKDRMWLGAYHRNEGRWHIWSPRLQAWGNDSTTLKVGWWSETLVDPFPGREE